MPNLSHRVLTLLYLLDIASFDEFVKHGRHPRYPWGDSQHDLQSFAHSRRSH